MSYYNYNENNLKKTLNRVWEHIKGFFHSIGGVSAIAGVCLLYFVPMIKNSINDIKEQQKKQMHYQRILNTPAYDTPRSVSSTPIDTVQIKEMLEEYKKTMPIKSGSSVLNTPIQFDVKKIDPFGQSSALRPPKSFSGSSFTMSTQEAEAKAKIDKMNKDIEMTIRRHDHQVKQDYDNLLHSKVPAQLQSD